jgi:hypothetical protein
VDIAFQLIRALRPDHGRKRDLTKAVRDACKRAGRQLGTEDLRALDAAGVGRPPEDVWTKAARKVGDFSIAELRRRA